MFGIEMVKKCSVCELNTGCTIRKGLLSALNCANRSSKDKLISKVVIVSPQMRSHLDANHLEEQVENPHVFGVCDGGMRAGNEVVESERLNNITKQSGASFVRAGASLGANWYSLNKHKRWTLFEHIQTIVGHKYNGQTDTPTSPPIRLVATVSRANLFCRPGATKLIAYCDSHPHTTRPATANKRDNQGAEQMQEESLSRKPNQYSNSSFNSRVRCTKPNHNQHFRGLQRPQSAKAQHDNHFKRCAISIHYRFTTLADFDNLRPRITTLCIDVKSSRQLDTVKWIWYNFLKFFEKPV